ncbi:uncharacterized protein G2W53_001593 [Senna tora]|uniref:Uncharacterized protein n=1 Tax=Senna tora TaxID=362788 RepID=A0A834XG24_9FABA|nr:uncharacterized protein G2W53_001593 [Senna tora]
MEGKSRTKCRRQKINASEFCGCVHHAVPDNVHTSQHRWLLTALPRQLSKPRRSPANSMGEEPTLTTTARRRKTVPNERRAARRRQRREICCANDGEELSFSSLSPVAVNCSRMRIEISLLV